MKRFLLYTLAALLWASAFWACEKEAIVADVVIPDDTNLMELESYGYSIPFAIQSDTDWAITFAFNGRQFCYAIPDHGTGSQTVKLCIIDNPGIENRTGIMCVDFPQDSRKNQVIELQQKARSSNALGADQLPLGDRVYAVGYGYNVLGERASANSVAETAIIAIQQALDDGKMVVGPMDASFVARTYSGSSVSELSNELSADASFGGHYLGFKGEVGASFGMKDFSRQENEYAISYVEADMQSVYMEMSLSEIINTYMTEAAYAAINGLPTTGQSGERETDYPSDEVGLCKLVKDYGTHLLMKARLGGRLKYMMTVDVSKVEGSYDLKAFANCSYKNLFVKASMDVSDEYKQSYANNSTAITTVLKVSGGGTDEIMVLETANGDSDANVNAWLTSLKTLENQTLVGMDNSSLIPLYDLVDISLIQPGDSLFGQHRYEALKAYINGDSIESDFTSALHLDYEMGDATRLTNLPDFEKESFCQDSSLIKDYYRGGQLVARVCNEYIPVISKTGRVTVIYPVVSNKVKYNMGYFAGDNTHRPARVCWSKDGVSIYSINEQPIGEVQELYVRGSSFLATSDDEIVDATLQSCTLSAPGRGAPHNYPLVKIFNQIWLRDNYQANYTTKGVSFTPFYGEDGDDNTKNDAYYYYTSHVSLDGFVPDGWRIPVQDDFWRIQNTLYANDVAHISTAKAFYPDEKGGVLGFYNRFNGRVEYDAITHEGSRGYYGCVYNDQNKEDDEIFIDGDNDIFSIEHNLWQDSSRFAIRLIRDLF